MMATDCAIVSGCTPAQYTHVVTAAALNKVKLLPDSPLPPAALAAQLAAIKAFPTISPVPMAIVFAPPLRGVVDASAFDDLRVWHIFVERRDTARCLAHVCDALDNVRVFVYGEGEEEEDHTDYHHEMAQHAKQRGAVNG